MPVGMAVADPIRLQLASGYEFSSGHYANPQRTEVQTVSLSATAHAGHWSLRVYVPWISLHGPSDIVVIGGSSGGGSSGGGSSGSGGGTGGGGSGGGGSSGGEGEDVGRTPAPPPTGHGDDLLPMTGATVSNPVRAGIGDTTAVLNYKVDDVVDSGIYVVVGGLLRIPTGNYNNGLGVGAVDFGLQTEIGRSFGDFGLYTSVGRRFRGNHSGVHDRVDGWQASLGAWYNASDDFQLGAYAEARQRIAIELGSQEDVGAYARFRIGESLSLQAYAETGLTSSSPDIVGGLRVGYAL